MLLYMAKHNKQKSPGIEFLQTVPVFDTNQKKILHCSIRVKLSLFHVCCCTIYFPQLWLKFNKDIYLKAKVPKKNTRRWILGHHRWDSASNIFVNNANDTFDVILRMNIYGFLIIIIIIIHFIWHIHNCSWCFTTYYYSK